MPDHSPVHYSILPAYLTSSLYQESFFQWCFGVEEPGCYGALDLAAGASILFVPRLPPEYAIWEGKLHTLDDFKKRYAVDEVCYTDEIARVLKEKRAHLLLTLVSRAAGNRWTLLSCRPRESAQLGDCLDPRTMLRVRTTIGTSVR